MHKARSNDRALCIAWVPDNDLLSHGQSVLSSARRRFTVLFGMGRGGASGLWSSGVEGSVKWGQSGNTWTSPALGDTVRKYYGSDPI